jgi:hypothetical protein
VRWIRLEVAFDESWLFALSPGSQHAWIKLLCTAKRDGVRGVMKVLSAKVGARKWSVGEEDVEKMYRAAIEDGALVIEGEEMRVCNWLKYQPLDRTAAQRQARYKRSRRTTAENKRSRKVTAGNAVTPLPKRYQPLLPVARDIDVDVDTNTDSSSKPKSKTTTSGSGEPTPNGKASPDKPLSWVAEGVGWWVKNVGMITYPRFGAALTEAVGEWTWPVVFDALKCYVQETKARGKTAKLEWFRDEIVQWLEWAKMPATDVNGLPTARGRAIDREFRT